MNALQSKYGIWIFLAVWLLCASAALAQDRRAHLNPPFDIDAIRTEKGRSFTGPHSCPTPPSPIHNLQFESVYTDRSEGLSIVDPVAKEKYKAATRPLVDYEQKISNMSDIFVQSVPPRDDFATCTLDWLYAWASHDALLGEVNPMGEAVRKWSLASLASSYAKVQGSAGLPQKKKTAVTRWLRSLGHRVKDNYSANLHRPTRKNNHLYWAAWSVMMAGVAIQDRALYEWAATQYHYAINQIEDDGTLPLEVARKAKAYNYHVFATAPLIMMAETAAQNGRDLYSIKDGALHKLTQRIFIELETNQKYMSELTNRKQNLTGTIEPRQFAWIEPYYARFRYPQLEPWVQKFRPAKQRRLGGDMSLLYGVTLPGTDQPQ